MKNQNRLPNALFILSVPFAYLAVWISADITAYFKNVPYNIPFGRAALSASFLFAIALIFNLILKGPHTSLLRVIGTGLITVLTAYFALALIETFYWSSVMKDEVNNGFTYIFGVRLGVYLGRFIPVSLCLCLVTLIIGRNIILKKQNKVVSQTF